MLANNIVRINGYKDGKRTHVDIKVKMKKVEYTSGGKKFSFDAPQHLYDPAQVGFDNGLDAVTSINMWNWSAQKRITEKIV